MECCQTDTLRAARKRSRDQDELRHSSPAKRGAEHARIAESSSCLKGDLDTQEQDYHHNAARSSAFGRQHATGNLNQPHQRDGKKVRVVQYPYKPLLPRDGFSWVKYGQKKLTTGDNMIRLYFQCGLRTSHVCPARRTVDLSCWDPSAPLVLNYHCTHNHLPHYHAAGAATTPAPLPKDCAVKNCSVRAIKRAVVKEEATTAKRCCRSGSPPCLPALASSPISCDKWEVPSVSALSPPAPNESTSSRHAPASDVADWRAALAALLNGPPVPATAAPPAPAPHRAPASPDEPALVPPRKVFPADDVAPLETHSCPLTPELLAALALLLQSALAEGESESVPANDSPQQQQQQHEWQEELPCLENTDCPLAAASLMPAIRNSTNCLQQSFKTSEKPADADFFQEMSPGVEAAAAASALAAAAESHLVNWGDSASIGADLLRDAVTWPSDSWPNAGRLLALEQCANTLPHREAHLLLPGQNLCNEPLGTGFCVIGADAVEERRSTASQQQLVICEDGCGAIQVAVRPLCENSKGFQDSCGALVDECSPHVFLTTCGSADSIGSSGQKLCKDLAELLHSVSPSSSVFYSLDELYDGESW